MNIDFSRVLTDFAGSPLKDNETDLTLKAVTVNALMAVYPDEQNLDGNEKVRRFKLAASIHGADGVLFIPVEDIALCKKLIGKGFSTIVAGQAIPMLEISAGE